MERCRITSGVLIGEICRRIAGSGKETCALWREAQLEPAGTISGLESIVKRHPDCSFQQEVLEFIERKAKGEI